MVAALRFVPFLLDHTLDGDDEGLAAEEVRKTLDSLLGRLRSKFRHLDPNPTDSHSENPKFWGHTTSRLLEKIDECTTSALLVAAAQVLNFLETVLEHGSALLLRTFAYKDRQFFECLFSLYGPSNDELLNIALLNLSRIFLSCLVKDKVSDESTITSNFEYLFPRINWILKNNNRPSCVLSKYIRRPIAILSDLCLTYPEACTRIKNSNTDLRIMADLNVLFSSSRGFGYLLDLKIQSGKGNNLVDFSKSRNQTIPTYVSTEDNQMDNIADHILLLSVYTSSNEECRRRISDFGNNEAGSSMPNFLCFLACEVVENFQFLSLQLLLHRALFRELQKSAPSEETQRKWQWFSQNLSHLLFLFEHPIYINMFYLLRSLSRSVATVETFFVDCNSIKSTYDHFSGSKVPFDKSSVSFYSLVTQKHDGSSRLDSCEAFLTCILTFLTDHTAVGNALSFFYSAKDGYFALSGRIRKRLYTLTTMVLNCLANFCLDFGPFRVSILENERFLKDISKLFKRALREKKDHIREGSELSDDVSWHDISYEQLQAQIGIFQIVHNLLYNETEENRRNIWTHMPLTVVFEKSLYGVSVARDQDPELHQLLLKLKAIAFGILRNLTLSSTFFCSSIGQLYAKYAVWQDGCRYHIPPTWDEYLLESLLAHDLYLDVERCENVEAAIEKADFYFFTLLRNPDYYCLLIAITYLEDNRHINTPNFKVSDFPSDGLLSLWKRILQIDLLPDPEQKMEMTGQNNFSVKLVDAKLAIVWNLINLLYEENVLRCLSHSAGTAELMSASSTATNINIGTDEDLVMGEISDPEMTLQDKSQRLLDFGFKQVLAELIYQMTVPWKKYMNSGKFGLLRRFDNINSNDLLDKLRTAYRQILATGNEIPPADVNMNFGDEEETIKSGVLDSIVAHHPPDTCDRPAEFDGRDSFTSDDEVDEPWIR
ncbi:hypothetical protein METBISCDRAFT_11194 [Metschnikowia bicuspidata]|uniref:Uncharacterized protein n=1 Tax=Metschnikowia bicuspidata TaxID=27322 RepID=A0A4V1J3R7_9ASCO|nr:hypothetical protein METBISCDRAFT_11194 [Metschnikowia bicuspidata]